MFRDRINDHMHTIRKKDKSDREDARQTQTTFLQMNWKCKMKIANTIWSNILISPR